MHQYVFGYDEIVAQFVAQMIPECRERGFGKCKAIGIANEQGKLLGGLVYRNWHPEFGTIEIERRRGARHQLVFAAYHPSAARLPVPPVRLPDGDHDHAG